jgi:hypothetical protein
VTGDSWGYSIGGFERHYSGWSIWSDGLAYLAQRKTPRGRRGPVATGRTLDDLAAAIEAAPEP